MQLLNTIGLSFDDVSLVPQKSSFLSRFNGEIDLSTTLWQGLTLNYPIISANMDTITGFEMAEAMASFGGMGIIHRFLEPFDHMCQLKALEGRPRIGCIGVGNEGLCRLRAIVDVSDAILIDVAHGHSESVITQIKTVKDFCGLPVIAGNVATYEGAKELFLAGADCCKVGVGPGSICSTKIQTGNGVPKLTAIIEGSRAAKELGKTIIADGGIKNSGDAIKALAAGANAVMIGSLFAGTEETPGEKILDRTHGWKKKYRGMASRDFQEEVKGKPTSVEGVSIEVPFKGSVYDILRFLVNGMLSGMSYQGAQNLQELHENAQFIRQTYASFIEGTPHGAKL